MFLLDSYEVEFSLSLAPYGEQAPSTRFRAYHSRPRKNRRIDRPVLSVPAIYAGLAQPPDSRTYSAEVTSFLSNLPHHRRLRPLRRPVIIQHTAVCVKRFSKKILADFPEFAEDGLWIFQKHEETPPRGPLLTERPPSPAAGSRPPGTAAGCTQSHLSPTCQAAAPVRSLTAKYRPSAAIHRRGTPPPPSGP